MTKTALGIVCVVALLQIKDSDGCSNVNIISRAEWGARAPRSRSTISVPVGIFFIHHTATGSCTTRALCTGIVRSIQNDHMNNRGWDDIGYSFLVGGDGNVYEGRGWRNVGAHTWGFNGQSFAASMIGNFNSTLPNTIALTAVKNLIACGVQEGKITRSYRLHGHRDVDETECPGARLYSLIKTWPSYRSYQGSYGCSNVNIISRAQWGASAPRPRIETISWPVGKFFIHHTAGRSCTTRKECSWIVRGIQNDHMYTRGFDDIGYSFLVGGDGNVYEGRGWRYVGAHTKAYNNNFESYGAAMIGNFMATLPNTNATTAVKNLIACGVQEGKISRSYRLHVHRDVSKTKCPGYRLFSFIKTWSDYRPYPRQVDTSVVAKTLDDL